MTKCDKEEQAKTSPWRGGMAEAKWNYEKTHSFGPHLRLCDLLFSFSRGRGLDLNPYLKGIT